MKKGNVLITGASRGIGRAIAQAFAKDGYNLTLCCLNNIEALENYARELAEAYHVVVSAYKCDVSSSSDVKKMFEEITPPDIVINNAGISYVGLLTDMSDDDWRKTIDTNLSSAFYICRAAIPSMVRNQFGKIINISSVWGNVGASTEVAYSASKGGLNSFTKALAKELAPSKITVNAVSCGLIDTEMNSHLSDDELADIIDSIPANRIGKPNDIASVVLNLAKTEDYLTGQIISVDGGWV